MQEGLVIAEKYRLKRPLRRGGMGSVWVAQNVALDMDVAIKVPFPQREAVRADTHKLLQEARLAARLVHPNIVRVFDFGVTESREPYFVMELLRGESLEDRLEREGRLDPVEAVQLMLPLCDALSAAHDRGVVHRDLKPANVFLAEDAEGRVTPKLLDFGIAFLAQSSPEGEEPIGTPDYMSPEQVRGLAGIDHRTDVWSFCVVLYELVSGSVPFAAVNETTAVLRAITEREVAPLVSDAPGTFELWGILERGLRKRETRYRTIRELGVELARWLVARGVEEDIGSRSVRIAWLGAPPRSPSLPSFERDVRPMPARGSAGRWATAGLLGLVFLSGGLEWSLADARGSGARKVAAVVAASARRGTPPPRASEPKASVSTAEPRAEPELLVGKKRLAPKPSFWQRARQASLR